MGLEAYFNSRVLRNRAGSFLLIPLPAENIPDSHRGLHEDISQYAREIFARTSSCRLSELSYLPKKRMLFFDIETCGVFNEDQICVASFTEINGDVRTYGLFARTPVEERAMLQFVAHKFLLAQSIFTYNGHTLDMRMARERIRGLDVLPKHVTYEEFEQLLAKKHHDLYLLLRDYAFKVLGISQKDKKLTTVEERVFNIYREEDVEGRAIPSIYQRFVYEGDNEDEMARAITHNMLDTITLPAILMYLFSFPKKSS